ncbi:MAG TPA: hypothetical protein DEV93_18310 [Chloroflexi bacterium]|jgi:uncharacterized protein involved in oxidation of intracellular sulfur|nr:hypothetical protein [Chloroflexota bacterium]
MGTIFLLGTNGTDDPTRASLPFHVAVGALEAGHQPQVGLGGEATYLAKQAVAATIQGVGMPALTDLLAKMREHDVPVYV